MTKITKTDLERALTDDRQIGWGFTGERDSWVTRPDSERATKFQIAALDAAVVSLANEFGWDYEMLFHFTNSKFGRHFVDSTFGFGRRSKRAIMDGGRGEAKGFTDYYFANPIEFVD
jgi:hypothetical protein